MTDEQMEHAALLISQEHARLEKAQAELKAVIDDRRNFIVMYRFLEDKVKVLEEDLKRALARVDAWEDGATAEHQYAMRNVIEAARKEHPKAHPVYQLMGGVFSCLLCARLAELDELEK